MVYNMFCFQFDNNLASVHRLIVYSKGIENFEKAECCFYFFKTLIYMHNCMFLSCHVHISE